jgi:hypothetical protein
LIKYVVLEFGYFLKSQFSRCFWRSAAMQIQIFT